MKRLPSLIEKLPRVTLVIALIDILFNCIPLDYTRFIYLREAVSNGELWRLFSGCFIHIESSHFISLLIFFLFYGFLFENWIGFIYRFTIIVSILLQNIFIYLFTDISSLVGFSGTIATQIALILVFLIYDAYRSRKKMYLGFILLFTLGILTYFIIEAKSGISWDGNRVCVQAHFIGLAIGLFISIPYLVLIKRRWLNA